MSELAPTVRCMDELHSRIRQAADKVGEPFFIELMRWHRAVVGLPDLDWTSQGAYRTALTELGDDRATDLVRDLRRAARDPRRHRHGADGKPSYRHGRTLSDHSSIARRHHR